jgi:hypothetical protein
MSEEHGDRRRRRAGRATLLALLLACLAGLIAYIAWPGASAPKLAACVGGHGAPEVRRVPARYLSGLRESVARVVPERLARLYEEGTILAQSAWSDEEPSPPSVSPTAKRPAGYEMRWWAPNGDDVVADVLSFASPRAAGRFVALASSERCRVHARRHAPAGPPRVSNLTWLNPDGAAEADVYMRRGSRVYRIADAPAGQHLGSVRAGTLQRTVATVDALACLLPGARCSVVKPSVAA